MDIHSCDAHEQYTHWVADTVHALLCFTQIWQRWILLVFQDLFTTGAIVIFPGACKQFGSMRVQLYYGFLKSWYTKRFETVCIFDGIYCTHYDDVIMTILASQITSLTVVYSIVYSGVDERKHQSPASLAFVRGIHRDRWIPRTKGQ